jgi:Zn-dependent protease
VLFVAAVAAHEIAHAIVARRRGVTVRSVTLWMLGGITELEEDPPTAAADLQIAIAGLVTSLAAGIVFGGAAVLARFLDGPAVFTAALAWLSLMNVTLAVFNLLPGAPLDGGRILRGLLWKRHGDRQRASRAAARSGQVLGTGTAAIGVLELLAWRDMAGGLWLMLIGWFLVTAARAEQQSEAVRAALAGLRVGDVMLPEPRVAGGAAGVLVTASFEPGIGLFTAAGLSGPPKRRTNSWWYLTCCRARSKVIKAGGRLQVKLRTFVPGAAPGQVPGWESWTPSGTDCRRAWPCRRTHVSLIPAGHAGLASQRPLGSVPTCTCWAATRPRTDETVRAQLN